MRSNVRKKYSFGGHVPLCGAATRLSADPSWRIANLSAIDLVDEVHPMAITEMVSKDIITAMKAKESFRVETLRMAKSALKSKEIDKRAPLDAAEEIAVLQTMIKQRREAAEQFAKGNRPELATKEQEEIKMLEVYMPQTASDDEIRTVVQGALHSMITDGAKPGPKDMGPAMRVVQQRIMASGLHADNKTVSQILKDELAMG
jgi:uncharacterized protein YqeY